ncbi:MAG: hypothetical protein HY979_01360 [Candidatus Magasanikbacteria bacterium]|nr:hypothetical protein [Candidatus Magasanikbacteria bacterium]
MKTGKPIKLFTSISQFITGLTILAFLVLVFFGMLNCTNPVMQIEMKMDNAQHSMDECVPGKNCGMDINKHLSIWQGMFLANVIPDLSSFFVLLIVVCLALVTFSLLSISDIPLLISRFIFYERNHRGNKLYNYFVNIFASGILQAKLYA